MRSILYGTTALVAVGMTAGAAGAAEKIKLGVSGYDQFMVGYTSQDSGTGAGTLANFANAHPQSAQEDISVKHNGEIWFKGSTKLDNGITIGVDYQLEALQNADQFDEVMMTVTSPTLGKLIVGDENGASYLMHLWAPAPGIHLDTGTIGSVGVYRNTVGGSFFATPLGTTTGRGPDNDSAKVTYISPRVVGLQLGVSYAPTYAQDSAAGSQTRTARFHDAWDVGLQYKGTFDGVGVGLSVGARWADSPNTRETLTDASSEMYKASASLSHAGFALGGGYTVHSSGRLNATTSEKGRSWIVSASYGSGPWGVGIGYFDAAVEGLTATAGNDTHKKYYVNGKYALGPGVNLVGAVFGFDLDAEGTLAQKRANGEGDNDGWGALMGLKLSF